MPGRLMLRNPTGCPRWPRTGEDKQVFYQSQKQRKLRMRWESGGCFSGSQTLHDLKDWPFDFFFCFVFTRFSCLFGAVTGYCHEMNG